MTDTRIDDSLSGRDLDAAIAEKLFGWRWATQQTCAYLVPPHAWDFIFRPDLGWREGQDGATERDIDGLKMPALFPWSVPRYSESWDAMRIVVEEMQRRGWSYCLSSPDDNSRHDADFEMWVDSGALIFRKESSADSLPTAVCRAALLALETEKPR